MALGNERSPRRSYWQDCVSVNSCRSAAALAGIVPCPRGFRKPQACYRGPALRSRASDGWQRGGRAMGAGGPATRPGGSGRPLAPWSRAPVRPRLLSGGRHAPMRGSEARPGRLRNRPRCGRSLSRRGCRPCAARSLVRSRLRARRGAGPATHGPPRCTPLGMCARFDAPGGQKRNCHARATQSATDSYPRGAPDIAKLPKGLYPEPKTAELLRCGIVNDGGRHGSRQESSDC